MWRNSFGPYICCEREWVVGIMVWYWGCAVCGDIFIFNLEYISSARFVIQACIKL